MSELQFEDSTRPTRRPTQRRESGISRFIMNHSFGLVKNQKQAALVQVVFVLLGLLYTFLMLTGGSNDTTTVELTPEEINQVGSEVYQRR